MISGPFASALDVAHVAAGGERYVPLVDPYNAAMHLGHMASYRHALLYAYGRQVLDLGCGTGYGAHYLASYGARQVVAVDVDPVALDYARQAYDHPRVEYQRCDGQRLPYADASFDFVFSSQAIEHVPDPEAFLREINRLLKQNGACLIITPAPFRPRCPTACCTPQPTWDHASGTQTPAVGWSWGFSHPIPRQRASPLAGSSQTTTLSVHLSTTCAE